MEIDKQTHVFRQGASLDRAQELYKFDTALRDLVFSATRQIEVALRSRVNYHFSRHHTPFWFAQVDIEFLISWLESITVLRNLCAHHARIWNRRYALKPQMPKALVDHKWLSDFSFPPDKIYPQLCCIAYLLNAIDVQNTFSKDIKRLLWKFPSVDAAAMGFPKGWMKELLWK